MNLNPTCILAVIALISGFVLSLLLFDGSDNVKTLVTKDLKDFNQPVFDFRPDDQLFGYDKIEIQLQDISLDGQSRIFLRFFTVDGLNGDGFGSRGPYDYMSIGLADLKAEKPIMDSNSARTDKFHNGIALQDGASLPYGSLSGVITLLAPHTDRPIKRMRAWTALDDNLGRTEANSIFGSHKGNLPILGFRIDASNNFVDGQVIVRGFTR